MTKHIPTSPLPEWLGYPDPDLASSITRLRLAEHYPTHWTRTQGVAKQAAVSAQHHDLSEADTKLLVTAAWFHDVGYCMRRDNRAPFNITPLDTSILLRSWGYNLPANIIVWGEPNRSLITLSNLEYLTEIYPRPAEDILRAFTEAVTTTDLHGEPCTPAQLLVATRAVHGQASREARALEVSWAAITLACNPLGVRKAS